MQPIICERKKENTLQLGRRDHSRALTLGVTSSSTAVVRLLRTSKYQHGEGKHWSSRNWSPNSSELNMGRNPRDEHGGAKEWSSRHWEARSPRGGGAATGGARASPPTPCRRVASGARTLGELAPVRPHRVAPPTRPHAAGIRRRSPPTSAAAR